ncbi:MAG: YbhB/YbcL family Raf kinase inhibitor-like protein [Treponema sp.]|nr:YbhB/YbcL family Raf kinase inhibitor-like protein [Treponema sp.]
MKIKSVFMILIVLFVPAFTALSLTGCDNGSDGGNSSFTLTSTAFSRNQRLADKYCYTGVTGGQNISLPFSWAGAPENTSSFALVIYDPDGGDWVHWAVFNIPPDCASIAEGASGSANMPEGCVELNNSFGSPGYGGPQPPFETGTHRYITTLYALNVASIPGLSGYKSYNEIKDILSGKVIERVSITGTYSR